jgi:hypothetical protein
VLRMSSLMIAVALSLSASGCAHRHYDTITSTGDVDVAPAPRAIRLTVVNDNFYDMNVYVVSGSAGTRLGTVVGNSRGNFVVNRALIPSGEARFVGMPIGGFGRAVSDALNVNPGQNVEFRIASNLALSTALVRR